MNKSGVGIDQRAEHFIAGFFDFDARLNLNPALGQFDDIGGHVRSGRTIDGAQAFELKVRGLGAARHFRARVCQLGGSLIDTVLTGLAKNGPDANGAVEEAVKAEALDLCRAFPIYRDM